MKITLFEDENQKGIWRFSSYLAPVKNNFRFSLDEGNTPEVNFDEQVILKREDQNPTGSLKDRGMAYLISRASQDGQKNLVLSSSGNAAISAAAYCNLAKINLFVFVSSTIKEEKLKKIEELGAKIFQSPRPISEAGKFAKDRNFFNLRPSVNEFGPEGYQTIAFELAIKQGKIDDLFLPVSSGVTLVGIAKGFKKLGFMPHLHACQSASICPIASIFDKVSFSEKTSLADSLVARFVPLKKEVVGLINESQGTGWVIENKKIVLAQETLQKQGIETSNEGALALAAMFKAKGKGMTLGKTVCLLTGTKY